MGHVDALFRSRLGVRRQHFLLGRDVPVTRDVVPFQEATAAPAEFQIARASSRENIEATDLLVSSINRAGNRQNFQPQEPPRFSAEL